MIHIFVKKQILLIVWPFLVHSSGNIMGVKGLRACSPLPGVVIIVNKHVVDDTILMNHEHIHFAQARELWFIGYPYVYLKEIIRNRIRRQLSTNNAYYANRLEYEAYIHQTDMRYLHTRKKFAWKGFRGKKKKKILYIDGELFEVTGKDTTKLQFTVFGQE